MAEENVKRKNAAVEAAKAAKSVAAAVKGGSRIAAGDVAGGVKDILADEGLRKIILGIIVFLLAIPIMMFALVPSVLFLPSEDAYSTNSEYTSLVDIIKGLFSGTSADAAELELYSVETDDMEQFIMNGLKDDKSLRVVADSAKSTTDFNSAPFFANETMQKMVDVTQDRLEKRNKALKKYIDNDFTLRKSSESCSNVTKTIKNDMTNGSTTSSKEALKIMALYTVQTDGVVINKTFDDYREWLGDEDAGFFKTKTADGYDTWKSKPLKWMGTMLPQKQMDEAVKAKEAGTFNESDYEEYYTSAVSEILNVKPEVIRQETHDADGNLIEVNYTYEIEVKSVDEICTDVVKFDEAIEKDADGNPIKLKASTHREEYYKELVGEGEGNGVTLEYFNISNGSGGSGSGADIVRVALAEVGYKEGSGNRTKYGEWYGMDGVAWCNIFISWCANECGYIDSGIIPKSAGCAQTWAWFDAKGLTHRTTDTSYTPKPGDLVLRGPGEHIEIVAKVDENYVYTVGGNTSGSLEVFDTPEDRDYGVNADGDAVAYKCFTKAEMATKWYGYCSPEYPASLGLGGTYDCTKYTLTDAQVRKLAAIISGEDSSPEGLALVASHMVNICEYWWNNGLYSKYKGDVYSTVVYGNPGWWAGANRTEVKDGAEDIIRQVMCSGQRTLPPYITEYDGFSEMYQKYGGQIRYLTIDGQNAPGDKVKAKQILDSAVSGESHVLGSFGGEGTFFGATCDGINGNVYYYNEAYKSKLGY